MVDRLVTAAPDGSLPPLVRNWLDLTYGSDTVAGVTSVNTRTGDIVLDKADVGLSAVNNTADSAKTVLAATKLVTPRNINGVAFDGTANIQIADSTKEPAITAGTTAQYWSGNKTWQTHDKASVGLGSVDNTADSAKAVLSASKLTTPRKINGINFDGTTDITVSTTPPEEVVINHAQTPTDALTDFWLDLDATPQVLAFPVTSVVGKTGAVTLTKVDVGLTNVDDTSDATMNAAAATLTNKTITDAKFNRLLNTSGNVALGLSAPGGTANYLTAGSANAGAAPNLSAIGSDTNIDLTLQPKGSGQATVNGVPVATTTGAQTFTNKTVTDPKINSIKDTNGNNILNLSPTSSAVNYLQIDNNSVGGSPHIEAVGADTNISMYLDAKGGGKVYANGGQLATTTGTETFTNKTLTAPTINGPTIVTPKISTVLESNGNIAFEFVPVASAINWLQVFPNSGTLSPGINAVSATTANLDIILSPKGTGNVVTKGQAVATIAGGVNANAVKDVSGGTGLWIGAVASLPATGTVGVLYVTY